MKKIILTLLLSATVIFLKAQAPDWQWARYATGIGAQETFLASTDPSGNAYLAGNFQNDITFGAITMAQTGLGIYLAKFDKSGYLQWLRTAGGIGSNAVYLVTTDKNANTYITGRFANQITFGNYTLTSTQANIYHIYIAKYDSSGNVLWARSAGETGNGYDLSWAINIDRDANVYISGAFQSDTIPLDTDSLISNGTGADFFLVKYDSSGHETWARSAECNYMALSQNLTTDISGNIYVTGYFTGDSLAFGNVTLYNQGPPAMQEIFIVSYDTYGNFRWAKSYGGSETDDGYGIATDDAKNVYVAGTFNSPTITFDTYTLSNPLNQYNYFLAKYDSTGNMIWLQSDSGSSGGYCITVDIQNNLYFSGRFYSATVHIDTLALQRPPIYSDPMFIVKMDSAGHAFWGKVLASGGDDQNGVSLGINGDIYVAGDFYGLSPFVVGNDSMPLTGVENAFIAKLGTSSVVALFASNDHVICPGTCTDFTNNSLNALSCQWFFPGSSTPVSTDYNPTNICYNNPGQYDVTLIVTNGAFTDTLTLPNYITVYPYPLPQGITQSNDTLFANPGAVSYQWYYNGSLITGATNYFYTATQSGDYNVIATDGNGCEVEAVIFNVIAGLTPASPMAEEGVTTFPNPVKEELTFLYTASNSHTAIDITIHNALGEKIFTAADYRLPSIDCRLLPPGIYWLELISNGRAYRTRFVKSGQ